MVSRIEVIPSEVRGYGNIVEAKSLSDFVPVESDLVYSENVYSLTAISGVRVTLTASSSSINVGSSVSLTATVMEDDTPVTGGTVSFYDGETLLGSDSTDSDGVATLSTSSLSIGSHSCTAVYDESTSNVVTVTVNKITSTLSLSAASSTITYGGNVSLSGTLSVGSGESVKIYNGDTLIDTVTTSTGGAFTKTVTGLNAGSYTFKATYEGDSTHSSVTSSNVSVTVNKATPTITLTVPSTGTVGTSYTVSGTLNVSGSVKLYEGSTLKDTLTVSGGSFSKSITQSSAGTYSYYAVFEATSNYNSVTSSTGSITVSDVAPSYDGVSLTSDKSILSYADSESATLTAQLLDGSSSASVSGVTVEFFKGSTSLGTATTNSSGVATKSYSSTGAGDISLTAEAGTFVSETFAIQDCKYWNDGSSVGSLEVGSNVSCTSNGSYITITTSTSGEKDVKLPVELSGDWEFETTLAENLPSGSQLTFKIGTGQQWGGFNYGNNITVNLGSSQNFNKTVSKDMVLKITYISRVMTVYWNNEQLTYKSLTLSSGVKMGYYTNNGRYQYIKDIKLKPL